MVVFQNAKHAIQEALVLKNRKLLENVAARLVEQLHDIPADKSVFLDALLSCAEASIQMSMVQTTRLCLDALFSNLRRCGDGAQMLQASDRILACTYFVLGRYIEATTCHLKGRPLVDAVLEAVEAIMKGLEVANSSERYQCLLYDASVHYWHVSRALQRKHSRQLLIPYQEKICEALEKVRGQDEWQVRHLMSLALCYGDAGRADDASKVIQQAYDAAISKQLAIQPEVVSLQVMLGARGKSNVGSKSTRDRRGAPKAGAPSPGKGGKGGKAAAPVLESAMDEEGALALVQLVFCGTMDATSAEQILQEALSKVDCGDSAIASPTSMRLIGRIGWAAAITGLTSLAEQCASSAAASQDLLPRQWSSLVRSYLQLQALGDVHQYAPSRTTIQSHIQALEQLDECVTSFLALHDIEGIHDCCRLIWNAGLVLLQPELRKHVKKPFTSAVNALEVVSSPLQRLKAQFHLEIARCEAAEDVLLKASAEVNKALSLDYVAPAEEQQNFQLERPLDRWLAPLSTALTLSISTYNEPSTVEEEALLLIEHSRESRSPAIRKDYLQRAMQRLKTLPGVDPPSSDYQGPTRAANQNKARLITTMWADVVKSAWTARLYDVIQEAALHALQRLWSPAVDKEMCMVQVDVCFIEADMYHKMLRDQSHQPVPPADDLTPQKDAADLTTPTTIQQMEERLCKVIITGVVQALSAKETWAVLNGGVKAWNIFLPLMQQQRYAELRSLLHNVLDAMTQLDASDTDDALLTHLAEAYAKAAEHCVLAHLLQSQVQTAESQAGSVPPSRETNVPVTADQRMYETLTVARSKAAGLNKTGISSPAAAAQLTAASEMCEKVLAKLGNSQVQGLVEMHARLQQLRGVTTATSSGASQASEQTGKVVSMIEMLASDQASPTAPKLQQDVKMVMDILSSLPSANYELWAKLGRALAQRQMWGQAVQCVEAVMKALPAKVSESQIRSAADAPSVKPSSWHWMSVAKLVQGQAMAAVLRSASLQAPTQAKLVVRALQQFAMAACFSDIAGKADGVEVSARQAWLLCLPLMSSGPLQCLILPHLQAIVARLNAAALKDGAFQGNITTMLVECLHSAGSWKEGVAVSETAIAIVDPEHLSQLLCWRAACLAKLSQNVVADMNRVKLEFSAAQQACGWKVLQYHTPSDADKILTAHKALEAVKGEPLLMAEVLLDYACWLHTSNAAQPAEVEAVLVAALRIAARNKQGCDVTHRQAARSTPPTNRLHSPASASLDIPVSPDSRISEQVQHWQLLVAILTSAALITQSFDSQRDYALAAQQYATKVVEILVAHAAKEGSSSPDSLLDWASFKPSVWGPPPLWFHATVGMNVPQFQYSPATPKTTNQPELFVVFLETLSHCLQDLGLPLHTAPVLHLAYYISTWVLSNEGMGCALLLDLAQALNKIGLTQESQALQQLADTSTVFTQEQEQELFKDVQTIRMIQAAHKSISASQKTVSNAADELPSFWAANNTAATTAKWSGLQLNVSAPVTITSGFFMGADPNPHPKLFDFMREAVSQWEAAAHSGSKKSSIYFQKRVHHVLPFIACEALLRRGRFMAQNGHYITAVNMLAAAMEQARYQANSEGCPKLLLDLSALEKEGGHPMAAVQLSQMAQSTGGSFQFWKRTTLTYIMARMGAPNWEQDVQAAVTAAVQTFERISREDPSAAREAAHVARVLGTLATRLCKTPNRELAPRSRTMLSALPLDNDSQYIFQYMEPVPSYMDALVYLEKLLLHPDVPLADWRPHLKQAVDMLQAAEQEALQLHLVGSQQVAPASCQLPSTSILATIRIQLARVLLELAVCREKYQEADREAARPAFPMSSSGNVEDVTRFLDESNQALDSEAGPAEEDAALTAASSATLAAGAPALQAHAWLTVAFCWIFKLRKLQEQQKDSVAFPWLEPLTLNPDHPPQQQEDVPEQPAATGESIAFNAATIVQTSPSSKASDEFAAFLAQFEETYPGMGIPCQNAIQALRSTVQFATEALDYRTIEDACLQLASIYGQQLPTEAAAALCLAQSAKAASLMRKLFLEAGTSSNLECMLMQQEEQLRRNSPAYLHDAHYQQVVASLKVMDATYNRLDISTPTHQVLQGLPDGTRVLLLHQHPNEQQLFGAFIEVRHPGGGIDTKDKKAAGKGPGKDAQVTPDVSPVLQTKVWRWNVSAADVQAAVAKVRAFKLYCEKKLVESSASNGQAWAAEALSKSGRHKSFAASPRGANKTAMQTSPSVRSRPASPKKSPSRPSSTSKSSKSFAFAGDVKVGDDGDEAVPLVQDINNAWRDALLQMEQLLRPLTNVVKAALVEVKQPPPTDAKDAKKDASKSKEPHVPDLPQVVMLPDWQLNELPLEAWSALKGVQASRCFSMHHFHSIMQPNKTGESGISLSRCTFIVDPNCEQSENDQIPAGTSHVSFGSTFQAIQNQLSKDVCSLVGHLGRVPGDPHYQEQLNGASACFYFGLGRFFSYLTPKAATELDLSSCSVAVILGQANNEQQTKRQFVLDAYKSAHQLTWEEPTSTSALLTLRGVKSTIITTLPLTSATSRSILESVMKSFQLGGSISKSLATLFMLRDVQDHELEHVKWSTINYGLPTLVASGENAKGNKKK